MPQRLAHGPDRYKVGTPHPGNGFHPDCKLLTEISHVTHVPIALRIVDDQKIKADLIFDDSTLNTQRIRVVWLSPNDWGNAGGFRYGNVRFTFDWKSLIQGKRYYWVESMSYEPEACRILVTDEVHVKLKAYDPTTKNGPWWYDEMNDTHYWNGEYTLEIMLERDLPTVELTRLSFVKHHEHQCCIDPKSCLDRNQDAESAAIKFISGLVANEKSLPQSWLYRDRIFEAGNNVVIAAVWKKIRCKISDVKSVGACKESDVALARAVLSAMRSRQDSDFGNLAKLFGSADDCKTACQNVIEEVLGLPSGKLYVNDSLIPWE